MIAALAVGAQGAPVSAKAVQAELRREAFGAGGVVGSAIRTGSELIAQAEPQGGEPGQGQKRQRPPAGGEGQGGQPRQGGGQPGQGAKPPGQGQGQAPRGEPAQGEKRQGQPGQGQPAQGQPAQGQPGQGELRKGEGQGGETRPGQADQGGSRKGEPATGEKRQGQPAQGEPRKSEGQQGEKRPGQAGQGGAQRGEPASGEKRQGQPTQGEPRKGEGQQGEKRDQPGSRQSRTTVQIRPEQRTRITETIRGLNVRPVANVGIRISVGTIVPRRIQLRPLPPAIVEFVPEFRRYRFFEVPNEIIIVDPVTFEIVEVISF